MPVFVRNGTNAGKGNVALLNRGGKPWPNPHSASELGRALVAAAEEVTAEPKQDMLPLILREDPAVFEAAPVAIRGRLARGASQGGRAARADVWADEGRDRPQPLDGRYRAGREARGPLRRLVVDAVIGSEWVTDAENMRFNEELYQAGELD